MLKHFLNKLTNIEFPEGLTSIGDSAFFSNALTSVEFPDSLTSIGNSAFYDNALTSVEFPNTLTSIGYGAFFSNALTSVEFPDSLTSIGNYAFRSNELTSIEFPNTLTSIGKEAFSDNKLTSIKFPDSLTSIGDSAFLSNKLTSIEFPDSLTSIGNRAFESNNIRSLSFGTNLETIGDYAFLDNPTLQRAIFNSDVKNIGEKIFHNTNNEFIIYGQPDSEIQAYALQNGYQFNSMNDPILIEPNGSDNKWTSSLNPKVIVNGWSNVALTYTWSQSPNGVPKDAQWKPIEDGQTIPWEGDSDGDWYLYVRAEDDIGLLKKVQSNLFKVDTTPPELSLKGNERMTISHGEAFHDPGYEVTDNFDENIKVQIDGTVDTSKLDTYTITYSATDHAGNITTKQRTITVIDDKPPVIKLIGDRKVTISVGTTYKDQGATATDNVDGDISHKIKKTGKVDSNKPGTYTIRYNVSDSSGNKAEAIRTVIVIPKTPSISDKNVTVKNNFGKDDVITFKNLVVGSTYTVYKDPNKKTKIVTFKADKKKITKSINKKYLNGTGGFIYVTVTKPNYAESSVTKINYKAEQLPALVAKNVTIKNNIGNDKITLKGLTKGFTYTIYKDSKLKKKLTSFKATGSTKTIPVKQIGTKKGQVFVVASKSGYTKSNPTKVTFKAEPTKALSKKNVKITNSKKQDTIKLTGLKKGTTYTIYIDAKKKKKLVSFKATSSTKTIKVKQLGKSAGKIYITAKAPSYEPSAFTTVNYSKEK